MPDTFSDRLQAYLSALSGTDRAMKNLDIKALAECGQIATDEMVGMLQGLDGRIERLERRLPANDA